MKDFLPLSQDEIEEQLSEMHARLSSEHAHLDKQNEPLASDGKPTPQEPADTLDIDMDFAMCYAPRPMWEWDETDDTCPDSPAFPEDTLSSFIEEDWFFEDENRPPIDDDWLIPPERIGDESPEEDAPYIADIFEEMERRKPGSAQLEIFDEALMAEVYRDLMDAKKTAHDDEQRDD